MNTHFSDDHIDIKKLDRFDKVEHRIRRLKTSKARAAFDRAAEAARQADIPALTAEVENAALVLDAPAARIIADGEERLVLLEAVEALLESDVLVIDACRNVVRDSRGTVPLTSRPVLFALIRALAEAWPGDVSRDVLLQRAFRARHADEPNAAVLAFLADGEAWSSSALAIALETSPRSVQRALKQLSADGKVQSFGNGRMRRWTVPSVPGFPTALLLPGPLPGD